MKITDVTNKVKMGANDGYYAPVLECVCGKTFGRWDFTIDQDAVEQYSCPKCGAKLFFRVQLVVYQVEED